MNKTPIPAVIDLNPTWYVVDAADQRLGRLATVIAHLLRGKHRPDFTPHMDLGDHVIVINAEKIQVTGRKASQKLYRRHSGRPGGMKTETFAQLHARIPERVLEKAIKGMLPHTRLGRQQFTKLKVYTGADHPHAAQQPQVFPVNTIPGA
ncbi:MAG: 50S ribosomal protein L13 [Cyanophyceae cyanobacterium]|jgi:large subunit ribosomal protein L13